MKIKNRNDLRLILMIILSLGGQIVSLYKSIYTAQYYGTSDARISRQRINACQTLTTFAKNFCEMV